jgi:hypothetical protein
MNRKLIKPLTILLFASLITGFVVYRAGVLDSPINLSPNGGALNTAKTDTIARADSLKKLHMMYSSKSAIIDDISFNKDTNKFVKPDSGITQKIMWSGSKSGRIFEPQELDTAFMWRQSEIISSSKSAIIFKPRFSVPNPPDSLTKTKEKK